MNKKYTDKDILNILAKTSSEIAPSKASLSSLLGRIHVVPLASPIPSLSSTISKKSFLLFPSQLRFASAMAIFVFALAGAVGYKSGWIGSSLGVPSAPKEAEVVAITEDSTTSADPLAATSQQSVGTSLAVNTPAINVSAKMSQSIASLPETVELQSALTSTLGTELGAQNELLALY